MLWKARHLLGARQIKRLFATSGFLFEADGAHAVERESGDQLPEQPGESGGRVRLWRFGWGASPAVTVQYGFSVLGDCVERVAISVQQLNKGLCLSAIGRLRCFGGFQRSPSRKVRGPSSFSVSECVGDWSSAQWCA